MILSGCHAFDVESFQKKWKETQDETVPCL